MSKMQKSLTLFIGGLMVSGLLLSGCSGQTANEPKEKKLVVAQSRSVTTLDNAMIVNSEVQNINVNIMDRLIEINDKSEYSPGLAEKWENPNSVTWRFYLRKNVKFHNGEEFNAEDVKFTFDRILDPATKSAQAGRLSTVKEIKIVDPYTIDIITKEPFAPLLNYLNAQFIVPKDYVQKVGNEEFGRKPIGTGPFEFVKQGEGEEVILKANKNYWKGAPKLDTVVFRPIGEAATRIAALQNGEVDIAVSIPPDRLPEINNDPKLQSSAKLGNMLYLGLDALHPPMDNVKVRQAINYAINKDTIIKNILKDTAKPMAGPFFDSTFGRDQSLKPYPYDPAKAKQLLAEAGVANGFETVLSTPPQGVEGTTNTLEVAQAIAQQLGEVGIKVKLDITDPATQFQRYKNKEFKMYLFTWDEQQEPDRYLYTLFNSTARGYYYKNTDIDKQLDAGRAVLDTKKRIEIYNKLQKDLIEDAPWAYLYSQLSYYGVNKTVVGFEPPIDGLINVYNVNKK